MLSRYDVFRANFERSLSVFRRVNAELRQELARAVAQDNEQGEHDRLKNRTDQLQREHDAMDSPPTTAETTAEHAEHRKRVRAHRQELAEHRNREN